jgi:hypothetical protein
MDFHFGDASIPSSWLALIAPTKPDKSMKRHLQKIHQAP